MYPGSTVYGSGLSDNRGHDGCFGSLCYIPRMTPPKILLLFTTMTQLFVSSANSILYFYSSIPVTASFDASFIINICILILLTICTTFLLRGLCMEKINELCLFLVTLALLTFYSVLDYYMNCSMQTILGMVNIYSLGIGTPIIALLTKWTTSFFPTQRIIGAADSLRYMYEARNNLLCVMRLDLLLSLILAILSYSLNDHEQHLGYLTACVIFIISLLKWVMGRTAIVKEIKVMVYVYVALSTLSQLWIPIQVTLKLPGIRLQY